MSVNSNMTAARRVGMVILSGNSHRELHSLICERLDLPEGRCVVQNIGNSETVVDIKETVRGKDVYIVQTGTKNVNNDIMEMLVLGYACRTSCARNIIGVIPYLPYCKQSKMKKRGSIVSRLLADMIAKAGFTHLITMDLHQKEIQGFYNFPVDNLRASSFLVQYIKENIRGWRNAVLVAKNPTYVNRASSFAERLRIPFAVVHGEIKVAENDTHDGRNSPPPELNGDCADAMFSYDVSSRMHTLSSSVHPAPHSDLQLRFFNPDLLPIPALNPKEKPPINIVGEVNGKIAIIVADMIDDVNSFIAVADCLKGEGALEIYVVVTHGLLSLDAPKLLEDSCIEEIIVTNTVPHDQQKSQCPKIKTVDISALFAEAIRRIHNEESMSHLFRNIAVTD